MPDNFRDYLATLSDAELEALDEQAEAQARMSAAEEEIDAEFALLDDEDFINEIVGR